MNEEVNPHVLFLKCQAGALPPADQPPSWRPPPSCTAILLYCNAFTAELIRVTTESRDLADTPAAAHEKGFRLFL